MTISSQTRKAGPFDGNDVTTSFPFTFKTFAKEDVKVIYTDVDEVETILVLDSDYTVTLNLDQNANPGGSVSYTLLATGEKLTILGNIEYTQETDIQNQGGFYPEIFEDALDKITMLIQQVKEIADRAVVVPASSSITSEDYLATINGYRVAAAASAAEAAASALAALGSANDAEADAIQTGLDRIQTGLDVIASASVLASSLLKANNLSDLTNAGTARTNLGVAIGTDVQAYDADIAKTDVAQTFTATQRTNETTDNDGSFDLNAALDFKCTPTAGFALTFTNIPATPGVQKGTILLDNSGGYAITAAATTKVGASLLSTISVAGIYTLGYRSSNGNVYVTSSGAQA